MHANISSMVWMSNRQPSQLSVVPAEIPVCLPVLILSESPWCNSQGSPSSLVWAGRLCNPLAQECTACCLLGLPTVSVHFSTSVMCGVNIAEIRHISTLIWCERSKPTHSMSRVVYWTVTHEVFSLWLYDIWQIRIELDLMNLGGQIVVWNGFFFCIFTVSLML